MAELYHNMAPIGRFKRAHGSEAHQALFDREHHWGRACCFACLGVCILALAIVLFLFFPKLYAICLAELLATILWALALRNYAPRLLGKAFWFTLVFFIVLATSLLMGTLQSAEPNPSDLDPLVLGPSAAGFNSSSTAGGLPLQFQSSRLSPNVAFPICRTSWGEAVEGQSLYVSIQFYCCHASSVYSSSLIKHAGGETSLNILDLSILAFASSFGDADDVRHGLGEMLSLESIQEVQERKLGVRWDDGGTAQSS